MRKSTCLMATGSLPIDVVDHMVENVIGVFPEPLGVANNFQINGKDYLIPMATEEPSVIAAASYAAKMVRDGGGFHTSSTAPVMIGQIQACQNQRRQSREKAGFRRQSRNPQKSKRPRPSSELVSAAEQKTSTPKSSTPPWGKWSLSSCTLTAETPWAQTPLTRWLKP